MRPVFNQGWCTGVSTNKVTQCSSWGKYHQWSFTFLKDEDRTGLGRRKKNIPCEITRPKTYLIGVYDQHWQRGVCSKFWDSRLISATSRENVRHSRDSVLAGRCKQRAKFIWRARSHKALQCCSMIWIWVYCHSKSGHSVKPIRVVFCYVVYCIFKVYKSLFQV